MAKFEKGSIEFQWFGEFWAIAQKFYTPGDTRPVPDEYFKNLVDDINAFWKKYADKGKIGRFGKEMCLAYLSFIDKEYGSL